MHALLKACGKVVPGSAWGGWRFGHKMRLQILGNSGERREDRAFACDVDKPQEVHVYVLRHGYEGVEDVAVESDTFVKNKIKSEDHRNLDQNQKTSGEGVGLMFLIKLEGPPCLFFLGCATCLNFVQQGRKGAGFSLIFQRLLGKGKKKELYQEGKENYGNAYVPAGDNGYQEGKYVYEGLI